jgi:hypothetical protein
MSETAAPVEWKLPTEQQFALFLKQNLMPVVAGCERERQGIVRHLTITWSIAGLVAAAGAAVLLSSEPHPLAVLFPILGGLLIAAVGYALITRGYRERFKVNVVQPIVGFFGPDYQYRPASYISQGDFRRSRLFNERIDRYRGEDLVTGTAGKTEFVFSEVHAEYKTTTTDSKGHRRTHWHTIFKGLFFIGDFHKHFDGVTVVLPDVAESTLGWIGQKLQGMNIARPGSLVKLEDPEFEKLFVVYGTDQVEARYILSPSLMQRLVQFRRECRREVFISFVDECVFVAAKPQRDILEPSVFRALNYDVCREIYADLSFALGIIEDLNLNTRIWSKR